MGRMRQFWSGVRVPAVPSVTVFLPKPLRAEVARLRNCGAEVEAIRLVREQTGLGLLPAYRAVQDASDQQAAKYEPTAGESRAAFLARLSEDDLPSLGYAEALRSPVGALCGEVVHLRAQVEGLQHEVRELRRSIADGKAAKG